MAALLSSLSHDDLVRRGTIGGGEWSAKDLVAHLGLWEELALEVLEQWRRGEVLSVEALFAAEGGTDRLNDEGVRRFLDTSWDEVHARFEDLHGRVLAALGGIEDDEWSAPRQGDPAGLGLGERLGSLLGSDEDPYRHGSAHLPDLRAYVDATTA